MLDLRGIIQYYDQGHKHVDIVVTRDHPDIYEKHEVGVDIPVNKGTIEAALAKLKGKEPGEVKWPHHIKVEDIKTVVADISDVAAIRLPGQSGTSEV